MNSSWNAQRLDRVAFRKWRRTVPQATKAALYACFVGGLLVVAAIGGYYKFVGDRSSSPTPEVAGRTASD
jgi:hypothetical protein